MAERPILFSAPMVRAILAGEKSMTRRKITSVQRLGRVSEFGRSDTPGYFCQMRDKRLRWNELKFTDLLARCPYGQPGDRLWVRETTIKVEDHGYVGPVYVESEAGRDCLAWGLAPAPDDMTEVEPWELKLRPAIHMPRTACRIELEITSVRVEQVQDITETDAQAEGVGKDSDGWLDYLMPATQCCTTARGSFQTLWESINGAGSWATNPWVWVVEFKRVTQ